jgi:hypothetical protein
MPHPPDPSQRVAAPGRAAAGLADGGAHPLDPARRHVPQLLPFGIAVLLRVATRRRDLLRGYSYPAWLLVVGWTAWLLTLYLAVRSVRPVIDLFA